MPKTEKGIKVVVKTVYYCPFCTTECKTEQEAIDCAEKDKFQEALADVVNNPDFQPEDCTTDMTDIDDVDTEIVPENAKTMDRVEKVTQTIYGRAVQTVTYERVPTTKTERVK